MANTRLENDKCYVEERISASQREADYMMYPGNYVRPGMATAPNMIGTQCGNGQCGGFDRDRVHLDSLMARGAGRTLSRCGSGDVNPLPPSLQNPVTCKREDQNKARAEMLPSYDRYRKDSGPYPPLSEMDPSVYSNIPRGYQGEYQGPNPLGYDPSGISFTQADTRELARQDFAQQKAACGTKRALVGNSAKTASAFEAGNRGIAPLFN